jgi:hypothetical protein
MEHDINIDTTDICKLNAEWNELHNLYKPYIERMTAMGRFAQTARNLFAKKSGSGMHMGHKVMIVLLIVLIVCVVVLILKWHHPYFKYQNPIVLVVGGVSMALLLYPYAKKLLHLL